MSNNLKTANKLFNHMVANDYGGDTGEAVEEMGERDCVVNAIVSVLEQHGHEWILDDMNMLSSQFDLGGYIQYPVER